MDNEETIEQAATRLGTPTTESQFDRSRALNIYLMTARELGTCLGGRSVTDLLADRTDWDIGKCKRLGDWIVDDAKVAQMLADEGVPTGYDNG